MCSFQKFTPKSTSKFISHTCACEPAYCNTDPLSVIPERICPQYFAPNIVANIVANTVTNIVAILWHTFFVLFAESVGHACCDTCCSFVRVSLASVGKGHTNEATTTHVYAMGGQFYPSAHLHSFVGSVVCRVLSCALLFECLSYLCVAIGSCVALECLLVICCSVGEVVVEGLIRLFVGVAGFVLVACSVVGLPCLLCAICNCIRCSVCSPRFARVDDRLCCE